MFLRHVNTIRFITHKSRMCKLTRNLRNGTMKKKKGKDRKPFTICTAKNASAQAFKISGTQPQSSCSERVRAV